MFSLFSLCARPTLVVSWEGEDSSYALVRDIVERVLPLSLLSRIPGEDVLTVSMSDLLQAGAHALAVTLDFSYQENSFQLRLTAQANDRKHLEEELEKRLASMLMYDALASIPLHDGPSVTYTSTTGYAALTPLPKGGYYIGLDAEKERWGSAVVYHLFSEEEQLSLLAATGGAMLLPGMRLQRQSGREVLLSISSSLSLQDGLALESFYTQDIGLYPFRIVLGGGLSFAQSPLFLSEVYAKAGVSLAFPLSLLFGLTSGFWRSSSVAMECSIEVGYAVAAHLPLYGSTALLRYCYRLSDSTLSLAVGNKHWVTPSSSLRSGLFMQLGLAYTW